MWGVFNVVCAALTQLNAKCLKQSYHSFLKTREAFNYNFTTLSQTLSALLRNSSRHVFSRIVIEFLKSWTR